MRECSFNPSINKEKFKTPDLNKNSIQKMKGLERFFQLRYLQQKKLQDQKLREEKVFKPFHTINNCPVKTNS